MRKMNKEKLKSFIRKIVAPVLIYSAIGTTGGLLASGGIGTWQRIAASNFFKGEYGGLRVIKRISEDETKIMVNYKDRHSISDPFLYANILPDGTITNISEYMTWPYKGIGELHKYANPRSLEEAAQSATNKMGNLAKWFGPVRF